MKVLIVFIAFSAAFVQCDPLRQDDSFKDNERVVDILAGLNSVVKQLTESVNVDLDNLKAQTQISIQNEDEELSRRLEDEDEALNGHIQEVEEEFEAFRHGQANPCLEDVPRKIRAVRDEAREKIRACRRAGLLELSSIREDIENYREINRNAAAGVAEFINFCKSLPRIGDKIKCAVDASRNISSTIKVIRENIANTSAIIKGKIRKAASDTHECISAAIQNAREEIHQIIEEARKCIDEQTTETSAVTEETTETSSTTTEAVTEVDETSPVE